MNDTAPPDADGQAATIKEGVSDTIPSVVRYGLFISAGLALALMFSLRGDILHYLDSGWTEIERVIKLLYHYPQN